LCRTAEPAALGAGEWHGSVETLTSGDAPMESFFTGRTVVKTLSPVE